MKKIIFNSLPSDILHDEKPVDFAGVVEGRGVNAGFADFEERARFSEESRAGEGEVECGMTVAFVEALFDDAGLREEGGEETYRITEKLYKIFILTHYTRHHTLPICILPHNTGDNIIRLMPLTPHTLHTYPLTHGAYLPELPDEVRRGRGTMLFVCGVE